MRQLKTMEALMLADLPDLSDWRFVPILSLEQAALLWGGIDPAFIPTLEIAKQQAHPLQYRRANIALQAFLGGIVLKTLTVYKLFLRDYNGDSFPAEQKSAGKTA